MSYYEYVEGILSNSTGVIKNLNNEIKIGGACLALFSYVFGKYWILFVGFLIGNVMDLITGCMKQYLAGKTSSEKGLRGIVKKFGYWIMIGMAFGLSTIFIQMGNAIGIDLGITVNIGYFVLGSLILNEARSIIENLVECGYHPPKVLTKGLEVAGKVIDGEDKEDK